MKKYDGPIRIRPKGDVQGEHINVGRNIMGALLNQMELGEQLQGIQRKEIAGVRYEAFSINGVNEVRIALPEPALSIPEQEPIILPPREVKQSPYDLYLFLKSLEDEEEDPLLVAPSELSVQILYCSNHAYPGSGGGLMSAENRDKLTEAEVGGLRTHLDGFKDLGVDVRFSIFQMTYGLQADVEPPVYRQRVNYIDDIASANLEVANLPYDIYLGIDYPTRYEYNPPVFNAVTLPDVLQDFHRYTGPGQITTTHKYVIYQYGNASTLIPQSLGFNVVFGADPRLSEYRILTSEQNIRASYFIPNYVEFDLGGKNTNRYPSEFDTLNTATHRSYAWELTGRWNSSEAIIIPNVGVLDSAMEFIGSDIKRDIRALRAEHIASTIATE